MTWQHSRCELLCRSCSMKYSRVFVIDAKSSPGSPMIRSILVKMLRADSRSKVLHEPVHADAALDAAQDVVVDRLDAHADRDVVPLVETVEFLEEIGHLFVDESGNELEHEPRLDLRVDQAAHDLFRKRQIRREVGVNETDAPHSSLVADELRLFDHAINRVVRDLGHVLVVDAVRALQRASTLRLEVRFQLGSRQHFLVDDTVQVRRRQPLQRLEQRSRIVEFESGRSGLDDRRDQRPPGSPAAPPPRCISRSRNVASPSPNTRKSASKSSYLPSLM